YVACAIATLLCYAFMMVTSYLLGQKFYPVPYAWKKMLAYIGVCIILYLIHAAIRAVSPSVWVNHGAGIILAGLFVLLVLRVEKKEIERIPYLRKLII